MAKQTLTRGQGTTISFPGLSAVAWHDARYIGAENVVDLTGEADTHQTLVHGIPINRIQLVGSSNISSTRGSANAATMAARGGFTIRSNDWIVGKRWKPYNITGDDSTVSTWFWGKPEIFAVVNGISIDTGPGMSTQSGTVTTAISQFGTISGTAKIGTKMLRVPTRPGGPVPLRFEARYSGAPTMTGAGFTSFFKASGGDDVVDPPRASGYINLQNGENLTGTFISFSVAFHTPRRRGGGVGVTATVYQDEPD